MNELVKIGSIENSPVRGGRAVATLAAHPARNERHPHRRMPRRLECPALPPLSSDTPPVADPVANPLGMAGLEFVEFAAPVPEALAQRFEQLGFKAIARHVSKNVTLYRQGQMHFLINAG